VSTQQQIDRDTYSLIITRRNGSELLCLADGPHCSLPSVDIPRWQRVAEQINSAVKERWNLDAYSLSTFLCGPPADTSSPIQFQVMECIRPDGQVPPMAYWIPVSSLTHTSFRDPASFQKIHTALREIETHPTSENSEPFARPGWLRDLCEWIHERVGPLHLRLTGQFRQLTASPTFNLIRFETNGPALWFKTVGEPNVHEFPIVSTLATLFPLFLPRVIASRPEWNAWLMTEAEGESPDAGSDFTVWKTVSARLAQLQTVSLHETNRLLAVGCRDISPGSLLGRVDEFFATMDELMKHQTKTSPPILASDELFALSSRLKEVLSALAASGIPDALNHLDLNPGNILVSDGHCVFIDWAEAAIGHPFFTFEYLLEHFKRLCPESPARHTELISSYAEQWERYASPLAVSRSLSLAPLAAVFAYAVSNGTWRDPARLANPQMAGYFRSLARRMKRAADALENRSLECICP
jgi:aminoglycoside phosphotransferase (APT) family kinase protein